MIDPKPAVNPLYLSEEALFQGIDLLFFAYRDFEREVDELLESRGLGRAHYRAMHVIGRFPGGPVSDALSLLKIRKQSLGRVLTTLTEQALVEQRRGTRDGRQKLLFLTEEGHALNDALATRLTARLARAYRESGGPTAVEGYRAVLSALISEADRPRLMRRFSEIAAEKERLPALRSKRWSVSE
ncbi:MAG: MarR family transcriptional regulator [Pseudomonadota bacterium]